jgi:hypothetical protein
MSEPHVGINFTITGVGSANIDLRIAGKNYTIEGASYTTDALGDLVRMALQVATGAETATASFDHEPVESRLWVQSLGGRNGLFLKVLRFPDIYGNEPSDAGDIAFAVECDATDFATAVAVAANRAWDTYGPTYSWLYTPFPLRALRALETALATDDPPISAEP